jgi:hypothetical protein
MDIQRYAAEMVTGESQLASLRAWLQRLNVKDITHHGKLASQPTPNKDIATL